jgi:Phosphotransferase system, galactitol-specific IIB component
MIMKDIKVLTVCGSGTVTSSMLSEKLKEVFKPYGYRIKTVETNPGGVSGELVAGGFDFIAYSSPIPGTYDIPVLNAVGFLTGFGEDEFVEKVLELLKQLGK